MDYIQIQQFKKQAEEMYSFLAWMKTDIDKYAESPKANQKAVNVRLEILQKMKRFIDTSTGITNYLIESLSHEYKRGFVAGGDRERSKDKPNRLFDKESYRQYFINEQRKALPNLF